MLLLIAAASILYYSIVDGRSDQHVNGVHRDFFPIYEHWSQIAAMEKRLRSTADQQVLDAFMNWIAVD